MYSKEMLSLKLLYTNILVPAEKKKLTEIIGHTGSSGTSSAFLKDKVVFVFILEIKAKNNRL